MYLARLICAENRNLLAEYQRPVPHNDPKKQAMTTYLQMHNPVQRPGGVNQCRVYELKTSELCTFPFVDVLTHVNMSVREDSFYEIPSEELVAIENEAAKLLQSPQRCTGRRRAATQSTQLPNDDGNVRLTVEATEPDDNNGSRRSSRTRTAVIFNS